MRHPGTAPAAMADDVDITTERLLLRRWRDADLEPAARMCADPEVMRHFVAPLTTEQTEGMIGRLEAHFEQHGFGVWALERGDDGAFLGFTGLPTIAYEAHFTPAVEIGWRLAREAWGHGYATEAARACVHHAFDVLQLDELVSVTVPANVRSRAVMERIGMVRDTDGDFDHPLVPEGHPIRPHVLYRLRRG
jgi:ribosomal-protein-alanine N-acetyltransferase